MIYVSWIRGDLSLFSLKQLALELEKDSFFFFPLLSEESHHVSEFTVLRPP